MKARMLALALLLVGCGEDDPVIPTLPPVTVNQTTNLSGFEFTLISEEWEGYCEDHVKKARVTFTFHLNAAPEWLHGELIIRDELVNDKDGPHDEQCQKESYELEFADLGNLTYAGTVDGVMFDCYKGPGNFERIIGISANGDGLWGSPGPCSPYQTEPCEHGPIIYIKANCGGAK